MTPLKNLANRLAYSVEERAQSPFIINIFVILSFYIKFRVYLLANFTELINRLRIIENKFEISNSRISLEITNLNVTTSVQE